MSAILGEVARSSRGSEGLRPEAYGTVGQMFAVLRSSVSVNLPEEGRTFSLSDQRGGCRCHGRRAGTALEGQGDWRGGTSIAAGFLYKSLKDVAEIRDYETTEQQVLELIAGRIDFIMASTASLSGAAEKSGNEQMTIAGQGIQRGHSRSRQLRRAARDRSRAEVMSDKAWPGRRLMGQSRSFRSVISGLT
ncbi:hypothetical protein [Microvirga antarctica]|uniref:hypothetical protein n=1 Tax=Microvirga antarctica TaxID=2819233 RepID=UPI001B311A66|nr:hypothetical protein [Microvirga antarctica]